MRWTPTPPPPGRRLRSWLCENSWSSDANAPGFRCVESIRYAVPMDTPLTRVQLVRWRTAVFAIFFATGLGFATWASRVPTAKANLGIDDFQLGILLFASGAASILGLSLANVLLARWGARLGLLVGLAIFAGGI